MERNTSLLPKKKKRKMRSKHFERVLFYSLKIIHPAETFPGMCDPSSKNSEFLKVVPGLCSWALGYSKPSALNLCCSSSQFVCSYCWNPPGSLATCSTQNITKCCKCHSSFRHLILTKVHCLKYPTLVNCGGLRAMGTPSTLSINSQILLKSAGLPALILTQVEQEKVTDNIFLNVMETSKPQRRSQTRWW